MITPRRSVMYMVVSTWRIAPGMKDEAQRRSSPVREVLRSQPGVMLVEAIYEDDEAVAVHIYKTEQDYDRIVNDPNGPFVQALEKHSLEEVMTWEGSRRGPTV
ncbi:MAG: hypothetical protein HUU52_10555 [Armatimonadetes bacterium]|nr:hypothetical protein [Armatimonadota bacterium]